MRYEAAGVLALAMAACTASPKVSTRDPEALRNKSMKIAVLEVEDRSGTFKPARLRQSLVRRLQDLGYERAGMESRDADATLACVTSLAEGSPDPRRAARDESVYSDPAGRRGYYQQDLYGESYRGPRVAAEATLTEARSGKVLYRAGIEVPVRDFTEETLAAVLLKPLEE